jgi:hypothetical protein
MIFMQIHLKKIENNLIKKIDIYGSCLYDFLGEKNKKC